MRKTDNYVLKELKLIRGQILTLDELDNKIVGVIDEEQDTNLGLGMEAEEILNSGFYAYCNNEKCSTIDKIYFEVINNTKEIDSTIKIV